MTRPTRSNRTRHLLENAGWRVVALLFSMLGHRVTLWLGSVAGGLVYRVSRRRRDVALGNLRDVFGDSKSPSELDAITRRSLRTLTTTLAELLWLSRADPREIEELVEIDESSRLTLKDAIARGRGVILVGIHFGRWELMFLGYNLTGERFTLVTKPLENPCLDAFLCGIRTRHGNSTVHAGRGTRRLHAVLRSGGTLLISIDHGHAPNRRVVEIDFLGQPAAITTGIARLAVKHGSALVLIYPLPLPDGRCRIVLGPIIEYDLTDDRQADIARITEQCASAAGAVIRAKPDYWMWSHMRLWRRLGRSDGPAPPGDPGEERERPGQG